MITDRIGRQGVLLPINHNLRRSVTSKMNRSANVLGDFVFVPNDPVYMAQNKRNLAYKYTASDLARKVCRCVSYCISRFDACSYTG